MQFTCCDETRETCCLLLIKLKKNVGSQKKSQEGESIGGEKLRSSGDPEAWEHNHTWVLAVRVEQKKRRTASKEHDDG